MVVPKIDVIECHYGIQIGICFKNGIHIFIPRWRILVVMNVENSNNKIRVKEVQEIVSITSLVWVDWITFCPIKVWIQLTIYEFPCIWRIRSLEWYGGQSWLVGCNVLSGKRKRLCPNWRPTIFIKYFSASKWCYVDYRSGWWASKFRRQKRYFNVVAWFGCQHPRSKGMNLNSILRLWKQDPFTLYWGPCSLDLRRNDTKWQYCYYSQCCWL